MKLLRNFIILFILLFFTACSSKNEANINQKMNSVSLNKNVAISSVPPTVKSPISIGIGLGGLISRHVGIHVGTRVRPDISNDDALKLEQSINYNNISLSSLITNEFDRQMKNDDFYKDKYVPFGANYKIDLFIPKYYLDTATFTSKSIVKIVLNIKIYNEKDELVYENSEENDSLGRYYIFDEDEILNSKDVLIKAINNSVRNCIAKIIIDMKKN